MSVTKAVRQKPFAFSKNKQKTTAINQLIHALNDMSIKWLKKQWKHIRYVKKILFIFFGRHSS